MLTLALNCFVLASVTFLMDQSLAHLLGFVHGFELASCSPPTCSPLIRRFVRKTHRIARLETPPIKINHCQTSPLKRILSA